MEQAGLTIETINNYLHKTCTTVFQLPEKDPGTCLASPNVAKWHSSLAPSTYLLTCSNIYCVSYIKFTRQMFLPVKDYSRI
jgi:hypothetical protein